jgi:hypothetical protein
MARPDAKQLLGLGGKAGRPVQRKIATDEPHSWY